MTPDVPASGFAQRLTTVVHQLAVHPNCAAGRWPRILESLGQLAKTLKEHPEEFQQFCRATTWIDSCIGSHTAKYLLANGLPDPLCPVGFGGMELAQAITGKAKSTIYNLVSQGKLPATKAGRLYFKEADLLAFVSQQRTGKFSAGANNPLASLMELADESPSSTP